MTLIDWLIGALLTAAAIAAVFGFPAYKTRQARERRALRKSAERAAGDV